MLALGSRIQLKNSMSTAMGGARGGARTRTSLGASSLTWNFCTRRESTCDDTPCNSGFSLTLSGARGSSV